MKNQTINTLYQVYIIDNFWKSMNPIGLIRILRRMKAYYEKGQTRNTERFNKVIEIMDKNNERINRLPAKMLRVYQETAYQHEPI